MMYYLLISLITVSSFVEQFASTQQKTKPMNKKSQKAKDINNPHEDKIEDYEPPVIQLSTVPSSEFANTATAQRELSLTEDLSPMNHQDTFPFDTASDAHHVIMAIPLPKKIRRKYPKPMENDQAESIIDASSQPSQTIFTPTTEYSRHPLEQFSFAAASNTDPTNAKRASHKSLAQRHQELLREKISWQQKYRELFQQHQTTKKDLEFTKQCISDHEFHCHFNRDRSNLRQRIKYQTNDHQTPINANNHSSNCDQIIIIDDILERSVSDQHAESLQTNSCCDQFKNICSLISNLTLILNVIRKMIVLFSTVFMIDCKLTGEGHFGIACIDQIRIISVDDSFGPKPIIYQNGKEVSIVQLNQKDECLLPTCSCIHPSRLRWHKLKNPELYSRCFTDQCNNPESICINKPNYSQCQMRHRMCMDINDWCGKPGWYPLNIHPAKLVIPKRITIRSKSTHQLHNVLVDERSTKFEFEINCDNGNYCCRFLLGSDISREYYDQNDIEWVLKTFCGYLHDRRLIENLWSTELELAKSIVQVKLLSPAYINRNSMLTIKNTLLTAAVKSLGWEFTSNKCFEHEIVELCRLSQTRMYGQKLLLNHKVFMRDVTSIFLKHYEAINMCLTVLFSSES